MNISNNIFSRVCVNIQKTGVTFLLQFFISPYFPRYVSENISLFFFTERKPSISF